MYNLPDWLFAYLMQFSKEKTIEIMTDAIDMMQSWNGNSMTFCIVSSIDGAECIKTDTGYKYRLPKKGAK